jgi:hypothetical protein
MNLVSSNGLSQDIIETNHHFGLFDWALTYEAAAQPRESRKDI